MSSATLNQFFQEIAQDKTLQQRLQEATDHESLVNKLEQLSKEKGYEFTTTDVCEWLESVAYQVENQLNASSELSQEELELVTGGKYKGLTEIAKIIGEGLKAIASKEFWDTFSGEKKGGKSFPILLR
ncbi:Nif11-like leader peptide family natural product precursor [Aerosakkonemataceae cyanobacterium BLCC-F50]|uniref:Nif11-like leader peptide family natural product n=1 Tax=Floridaenema flaviceps BLCC-F50 TaxID=3153642 RepID=A0ABV4XNG0_9CYAN